VIEENIEFDFRPWRGISRRTMEFYGVQTKLLNGKEFEVAFPYGEEAVKVRPYEGKQFKTVGKFKDAGMFGQDRFDRGSKDSITICEGEPDALSAYEILRGRSACVSLKTGAASAYTDAVNNYEYINSFPKIYLCFDNDKAGQDAIRSLQGLFDFRKVYHVKFHKRKDANEYLQAGEADDFESTWAAAKRFAPDNIISTFSDIAKSLEDSSEDRLGDYPFPDLSSRLYGLHGGEVIVVKAPEGVGKTEFLRAVEHHILKTTEHPIGIIHLEEDNGTTVKAIAGYELQCPAVLPDCGLSKQDILDGYKRAVRDDEGRVHIHASFDIEDEEAFLGNIRFLVSALGCRFIFLDHITWLATGLADDDERKKLDRLSQRLKLLAKELRFCLFEISHVNDDGKTRGSRNISKVANTVISLDRDLLAGANVVSMTVEKARLGGRTGPAGHAWYDRNTGRLEPHEPEAFLPDMPA
jgi:twinkle protein